MTARVAPSLRSAL